MGSIRERLPSRGWSIAFGVPVLLALALCLLLQPRPATLAAPLFGPWAGWLYGHEECTLAAFWPRRSFATLATAGIFLAWRLRETDEAVRGALSLLLLFCELVWCAFAVLSVLNTTS